ncbi:MAG: host attachment protein [Gammaproteobacteria bacterium]|nr:host attachment protein [Gammaproteobacteria bacterium]
MKIFPTTWIVVGNSSIVRILEAKSLTAPLLEITTLSHPESRAHEQELTQDMPGRAFDSVGRGRHAMEVNVGPKQQEQINFAKQLDGYLDGARKQNKFDRLIITASPGFLGLIRSNLNSQLTQYVTDYVNKDLVSAKENRIRTLLEKPDQ